MIRRFLAGAATTLAMMAAGGGAHAATQYINAVPTNWRMQDYVASVVQVYYIAGAPNSNCYQSGLTTTALKFSTSASADEMSRFWTMVITAKTVGHAVIVFYDDSTCYISSFAWAEG
jgi:hypothetical protein